MTPQAVIDLFRLTVFDTVATYLWSNDEAREYLNDAQKMMCRLMYGINDGSTTSVTDYAVAAGDEWITLHPAIMKVRSVQRLSDFRFIAALNIEDLQAGSLLGSDDYGRSAPLTLDATTGELRYIVLGISDGMARLVKIPAVADTVRLTVERLPLEGVTKDNLRDEDALEVREEHHRHLVWWMAHLAYLKQDAETLDKTRAAEFEQKFRQYCEQARLEKERRQYKPRLVMYGGY